MPSLRDRLNRHFATAAIAGAATAAPLATANAAIVYSGPVNIVIPDSLDGIYLDVVTGASSSTTSFPGWDINPFSGVPGELNLWGPTANTWLSLGNSTGPYILPPGTPISGPLGDFFRPGVINPISAELTLNSSDNLLGFRFLNELTNDIHFGWIRLEIGDDAGVRSIVEYAYEDQPGVAIGAGVIPEPATLTLVALSGLVLLRRRNPRTV